MKCDMCDAEATNTTVDVIFDGAEDGWAKWKLYGKHKYGCTLHPVGSVRFLKPGVEDIKSYHEMVAAAMFKAGDSR